MKWVDGSQLPRGSLRTFGSFLLGAGNGRGLGRIRDTAASTMGGRTTHTATRGCKSADRSRWAYSCFTPATTGHASTPPTYSSERIWTTRAIWSTRDDRSLHARRARAMASLSSRIQPCERSARRRLPEGLSLRSSASVSLRCHSSVAASPGLTCSNDKVIARRLSQGVLDFGGEAS